ENAAVPAPGDYCPIYPIVLPKPYESPEHVVDGCLETAVNLPQWETRDLGHQVDDVCLPRAAGTDERGLPEIVERAHYPLDVVFALVDVVRYVCGNHGLERLRDGISHAHVAF